MPTDGICSKGISFKRIKRQNVMISWKIHRKKSMSQVVPISVWPSELYSVIFLTQTNFTPVL